MTAVSTGLSLAKLWVKGPQRTHWVPPNANDLHRERYAIAKAGRETLEPFRSWLVEEGVTEKTASNYVQGVWASLMRTGGNPLLDFENKAFTASTKLALRAAWTRFAEWAKDEELEKLCGSKLVKRTIADKRHTRASKAKPGFGVDVVDQFLAAIDRDINSPDRPWRWPVLRTMLILGLRAGVDVTWITREAVTTALQFKNLTIISKGDKQRTLPAGPVLAELTRLLEFGEWVDVADLICGDKSAPEHRHSTAYAKVRYALKEYAMQLGIDVDEVQSHRFRRSAVLRLYAETKDILLAQALLGHAHLSTTQRYLEDDRTAELGEVLERAYARKEV